MNAPPVEYSEEEDILDSLASLNDRADDDPKVQIERVTELLSTKLATGRPGFNMVAFALRRTCLSLPIKAPSYATVVGLLTTTQESYANELAVNVTTAVSNQFAASLRDGKAAAARRALRFIACLAECYVITATSLADHILALLKAANAEFIEPRSERGVHCRGPFLAEIGLSALPWAAKCLNDRVPDKLGHIMTEVQNISDSFVSDRWRCVAPSTDARCVEVFSELLAAVFHLENKDWVCSGGIVPRPQDEFETLLASGQKLPLPKLNIPSHSKLTRYSCPRFRLCLVNAKSVDSIKKKDEMDTDDKSGIKDKHRVDASVTDLTEVDIPAEQPDDDVAMVEKEAPEEGEADENGEINLKKEATIRAANANGSGVSADPDMPSMDISKDPQPANGDTANPPKNIIAEAAAAQKHPPTVRSPLVNYILRCYVDDIVDNFAENHIMAAERLLTLPMFNNVNDEIVECVFSQMCSLPEPMYAQVYYGTLFVDLCRVKDSRLPAKLLTSVETMFQEAEQFDPETFDRLTDWFSFHLSNFGYKWNWADWALYADEEMIEKFPYRAIFCKDVLARCIRLSYYDRVLKIIPSEMKFFLPAKPNMGNKKRFDEKVNNELMRIVTGRDKKHPDFVKNKLEELIPIKSEDPENDEKAKGGANLARLAALIRSILQAGCKTLSHFDIVSERFETLLRGMAQMGGPSARRLIALEVTTFWTEVHIRRMYVLDKLRARGIIDGASIIDSCLAYQRVTERGAIVPIPDKEIMENLSRSSHWELIRLVFSRACSREDAARSELNWARKAAAAANEGDSEKAEAALQQSKANTEKARREVAELLLVSLRRLFGVCARLLNYTKIDNDSEPPHGEKRMFPGFSGKPVWYWRCAGMIRELARKHPQHVPIIIDALDNDTKDNRDQHRVLWESFEVVKEVEGSAMLSQLG